MSSKGEHQLREVTLDSPKRNDFSMLKELAILKLYGKASALEFTVLFLFYFVKIFNTNKDVVVI